MSVCAVIVVVGFGRAKIPNTSPYRYSLSVSCTVESSICVYASRGARQDDKELASPPDEAMDHLIDSGDSDAPDVSPAQYVAVVMTSSIVEAGVWGFGGKEALVLVGAREGNRRRQAARLSIA